MSAKKILGLDLGTNSIGWALVSQDFENRTGSIDGIGSRIIPMSQDVLGKFGGGVSISQTAERTRLRSMRRLRERNLLRRERLHRVLHLIGFLPNHYSDKIDFQRYLGQFFDGAEPKLAFNKSSFLFQNSFNEMLADFKEHQPDLLLRKNRNGEDAKIPYDWTIYFLRKKALTARIEREELAWIILNFNQKRGYYQLRDEVEDNTDKRVFVEALKIVQVEKGVVDKINDKRCWYHATLSNGWIYSATFVSEPQFLNEEKEFLITEELEKGGAIKIVKDKKSDIGGKEKRKITLLPTFEEIELMSKADQDKIYSKIKAKTESTIINSGKTVGTYIYDTLLKRPDQKINGKLIRTIDRKFYKDELERILKKQQEFHPELKNESLYADVIRELYRNNDAHQMSLAKRDMVHLLVSDILFYQRPLASKKSDIGNCAFEFRQFKDNDGKVHKEYLKAIPKSNPFYQEFRVWQWLYNLKIYLKENEKDVTSEFIEGVRDWESLFDFLMSQRKVGHKEILKHLLAKRGLKDRSLNIEIAKYRWNYVYDSFKGESKEYPCNETGSDLRMRLAKVDGVSDDFLTPQREYELWHLIYSVTDKIDYEKALKSFARKYNLNQNSFLENFKKIPPYKNEYGSFSEKAIKKLLPLMRIGKYWKWESIDFKTQGRIQKIITGECDEDIQMRVREKAIHLTCESDFQGLQLWLVSYVVYDRHAEAGATTKWNSVSDLEAYLNSFKQHSLRNPIVEQVVTETLRVVKDIWSKYGNGKKDFFDEIHVELGREMKNPADERKRLTNIVSENENTNLRIKAILMELVNDAEVENVRPHSPSQQEILKIYEDGVLNSGAELPEFVADTLKKFKESDERKRPSSSEITRYKLWLEQKYRSPYTAQTIPLNKLFTAAYEVEHIIPQSRYFDDSLSNKVICEAAVNKLKDNQLGLEFIRRHGGRIIETGYGKTVNVLTEQEYTEFVQLHYAQNRAKRNKLLLEEIPEAMIERQLNDTRYISKFVCGLLSNVVRSNNGDDGPNSKNLISGNGKITTALKQDWGLNEVWNELILPRFERMNQLTNSCVFTTKNKEGHTIPTVPFELTKGFQKKRIDHRHHAMDALIIACATRNHVNLLNNLSAKSANTRYDLQRKLRKMEYWQDNKGQTREKFAEFITPWPSFRAEAKVALENLVVSYKQTLRVINKATNWYYKWEVKDGKKVKSKVEQEGVNWAIRKQMHKDTISGKVDLPRVKVAKGKILTATRKSLDTSFDLKAIESITDTGIQKILRNYLMQEKFKVLNSKGETSYNAELAFSPEGIDDMNKHIRKYNGGKSHQPILKFRVFEQGSKFALGNKGNRKDKYVEAAQGTNLFFAIYQDEGGKRSFESIPLNLVIERQKQGLSSVPEINEGGNPLLFYISPGDIVYFPSREERYDFRSVDFSVQTSEKVKRIFVVNDFSSTCYFTPNRIAKAIAPKEVDLNYDLKKKKLVGSYDHKTASFEGEQIKDVCIKLNVDRLGVVGIAGNRNMPLQYHLGNKSDVVSDSFASYNGPKEIRIAKSYEASENAQLEYWAGLSPEQRFADFFALMNRFYQFVQPNWSTKKIIIDP